MKGLNLLIGGSLASKMPGAKRQVTPKIHQIGKAQMNQALAKRPRPAITHQRSQKPEKSKCPGWRYRCHTLYPTGSQEPGQPLAHSLCHKPYHNTIRTPHIM